MMEAGAPRWRAIDPALAEAATRQWIESVVIGQNLCPFASKVRGEPSRVLVTDLQAGEPTNELMALVGDELGRLAGSNRRLPATTFILLRHESFADFDAYMEVALDAQDLGAELVGEAVQVVLFHPRAQWGDTDAADAADYSTRSPLPMLHLLRGSDVQAAEVDWVRIHGSEEAAPDIQATNAALLRGMGAEAAHAMLEASFQQARAAERAAVVAEDSS